MRKRCCGHEKDEGQRPEREREKSRGNDVDRRRYYQLEKAVESLPPVAHVAARPATAVAAYLLGRNKEKRSEKKKKSRARWW
jgi:hypothetical protein